MQTPGRARRLHERFQGRGDAAAASWLFAGVDPCWLKASGDGWLAQPEDEAADGARDRTSRALFTQLWLGVAGGYGGLVPIDVDTDDPAIVDAVASVLP